MGSPSSLVMERIKQLEYKQLRTELFLLQRQQYIVASIRMHLHQRLLLVASFAFLITRH
jgi:hypothetical protein